FSMIVLLFFHNFNSYFVNSEVRSSLAFPEGLPTKEVRSTYAMNEWGFIGQDIFVGIGKSLQYMYRRT
ncbi:hypothetical protein, partial [Reichenbachiella sp. MALMAid0571]|uniref:hypothetical protein n=1 Tax=Reichenbachiella sp. MALMAid0571 TaxID=3143939 RepID=UPI0032DEED8F